MKNVISTHSYMPACLHTVVHQVHRMCDTSLQGKFLSARPMMLLIQPCFQCPIASFQFFILYSMLQKSKCYDETTPVSAHPYFTRLL